MCYKKWLYTVGLGDIASFDPVIKMAALLQIRLVLDAKFSVGNYCLAGQIHGLSVGACFF